MKRPKKEPPDFSGGCEPKVFIKRVETHRHKSEDVRSSWIIPPDSRDGLEVFIGQRGGVVLKQHQDFSDEQSIVLHPDEARRLLEILPAAILAAKRFKGGIQ